MRKPDENLDDYIVKPAPEVSSEPPRSVWLWRTGKVEVLKPLTHAEVRANSARSTFKSFRLPVGQQPLWFRRFLVVGSGALVFIAAVLVSAILVGINDPVAGPDVATKGPTDDKLTQLQEPYSFDLSYPLTLLPEIRAGDVVRSHTRRRMARPRTDLKPNKTRARLRPLPQPEVPTFVPTTLVIYAENGVINTRIEPWFPASDKRNLSF